MCIRKAKASSGEVQICVWAFVIREKAFKMQQ